MKKCVPEYKIGREETYDRFLELWRAWKWESSWNLPDREQPQTQRHHAADDSKLAGLLNKNQGIRGSETH